MITFSLPGFEENSFEYHTGLWKNQVLHKGQPIAFTKNKGQVADLTGNSVTLTRKMRFGDPLPYFEINGESHHLRPPLKGYEIGLSMLPLVLVGVGGAIGGFIGAIAWMVNSSLMRKEEWSTTGRVGAVLATTFMACITHLIVASFVLSLIH